MKKIALAALITTMVALSACSKPVTPVKAGETATPVKNNTSAKQTSSTTDLQADLAAIQNFGLSQEQEASGLQQRLDAAMQAQDTAAMKALFSEFKNFVAKSNLQLSKVPLKTAEAQQLREKMLASSELSLEMSELILTAGSEENINQAEFQNLQQRAMQLQQELGAISEQIYIKLHGSAPAPLQQELPPELMDYAE